MRFFKEGAYIMARVADNMLYKTFPNGTGLIRIEEKVIDNELITVRTVIYNPNEIDFRGIIHYKKKFRNAIDKYMEGET